MLGELGGSGLLGAGGSFAACDGGSEGVEDADFR